jgi:hypothetical protein
MRQVSRPLGASGDLSVLQDREGKAGPWQGGQSLPWFYLDGLVLLWGWLLLVLPP